MAVQETGTLVVVAVVEQVLQVTQVRTVEEAQAVTL
jgi:hypothetical protein